MLSKKHISPPLICDWCSGSCVCAGGCRCECVCVCAHVCVCVLGGVLGGAHVCVLGCAKGVGLGVQYESIKTLHHIFCRFLPLFFDLRYHHELWSYKPKLHIYCRGWLSSICRCTVLVCSFKDGRYCLSWKHGENYCKNLWWSVFSDSYCIGVGAFSC